GVLRNDHERAREGHIWGTGYLFLWETLVATVPGVKSPHLPGPAPTAGRLAERLGRFQVDHQFELRGLLHGQIGGLGPFGDLVDVLGGAAEQVRIARRIGLCGAISCRDHREWPDTRW